MAVSQDHIWSLGEFPERDSFKPRNEVSCEALLLVHFFFQEQNG
jgi:hypothetical protein